MEMAMSGKADPNLGALEISQRRDIVLLNLEQPTRNFAEAGKQTDEDTHRTQTSRSPKA